MLTTQPEPGHPFSQPTDLKVLELATGAARTLFSQPTPVTDPGFSPDGKSIAFSASTNGQFDIWAAPAGGGAARRVTSLAGDERWPSWTLDGRLVVSHRAPGGSWRLVVATADGKGEPQPLWTGDASEWQGRVSPDAGKWIAFVSDREPEPNNDADIWAREFSAAGGQARSIRVTRAAGVESFPAVSQRRIWNR